MKISAYSMSLIVVAYVFFLFGLAVYLNMSGAVGWMVDGLKDIFIYFGWW